MKKILRKLRGFKYFILIFRSMVGSPVPPRLMRNRRLATCPSVPTPTGATGPTAEETFAGLERLAAGLELATVFQL